MPRDASHMYIKIKWLDSNIRISDWGVMDYLYLFMFLLGLKMQIIESSWSRQPTCSNILNSSKPSSKLTNYWTTLPPASHTQLCTLGLYSFFFITFNNGLNNLIVDYIMNLYLSIA